MDPAFRSRHLARGKRALDLVVSAALTPFAFLLCAACALAIRLESPGNPIFAQRRMGAGGRTFTLLKLRTMYVNTRDLPSHEVPTARVTRVGRFLRRTKLDELPQLLNVLRGEMSLVGPRPCLPTQHELVECRNRHGLAPLPPGITGPGQLSGLDMSTPAELAAADATYLGGWSLRRDLSYLARTAGGQGNGDAVPGVGAGVRSEAELVKSR